MEHCNYFDPRAVRACPFCKQMVWTIPLLSGIALISLVATKVGISEKFNLGGSLVLDSLSGLIVFVVLTGIAGSLF